MTSYIPSLTLPSQLFANPAISIFLPIAGGSLIGIGTSPRRTKDTYMALKQPPFRPPSWVFGPAWTLLYGLMGYAAWRAWTTGSASPNPRIREWTKHGATLYSIQLALNYLWMPLFFSLRRPILAAVDIISLGGVVGYMTYIWGKVDNRAAWALGPYMCWLTFATYLNIGVGVLNDWDFDGRERATPPGGKQNTQFINEKEE
jgi:translocator protein